jgi:hypothetical protein
MKHSSRTAHRHGRPRDTRLRVAAALCVIACAWAASARGGGRQEWEALQKRMSEPRNVNLIVSGTWTLIHGAEADAEVKELLNLIGILSEPFDGQKVGGAAGFKDGAASFLKSKDVVVSGFAAQALVLMGAEEHAADVVPLLERGFGGKHYLGTEDFHPLVEGELERLRRRYEESFLRMRARRAK